MQINENININFDAIPIEEFWNTGDVKENKMHRIHAYPAKFPAFITSKAIDYAENYNQNINWIADMFCGCGTTAYEATRNGKNFWGSDINPVATLIAKTKSQAYKDSILLKYYDIILINYNKINISQNDLKEINERIWYWFKEEQTANLLKLKFSIYQSIPLKSKYLNFFLTAFSNILKPTSIWLTKSIKPQIDPNKKPANVLNAFSKQFDIMRTANLENDIHNKPQVKIENINFLNKKTRKPFVDLIVTSPPYVTSYEYADLHQLSTLWLDFADDYKSLRKGSIGSLYHNSNFVKDAKQLNKTGEDIVFRLYNQDKRKAKSTAKYFVDMQKTIKKSFKMLNENGIALFVIGNTEYKGIRINNAKHLVESMLNIGYRDIEITKRKISNKILTPYRDKNGKFTTDKNSRKVYAEEFIVIGKKKNG
ncbi:MAG: class I SAM-dependent methyltransferase [Bacteroidetes bacterium]|nr:MAG: class I SAM-dependent methyltransferase [Bacteroidota bacterium]